MSFDDSMVNLNLNNLMNRSLISEIGSKIKLGYLRFLILPWVIFLGGVRDIAGQVASPDSVYTTSREEGFFFNLAGFGEKVLDKVTWEQGDYVFTVYPSGGYSPRNGLEVGLMPAFKWESSGRVNTITMGLEVSARGMLQFQSRYEWFFHEFWQSRGELTWNRRHDKYWPGSENNYITFDRREFSVEAELLRCISNHLWGGFAVQASENELTNFEFFEDSGFYTPGMRGGSVIGGGPLVVFDSRNRALSAEKGMLLRGQALFFGVGGMGSYSYNQYSLDGRKYMPVGSWNGVLAWQVLVEFAGKGVPFYQAPYLGGKSRLRGIGHPLRSTGQAVWLARGEYRQPLWWRLGGVLFAGSGKASPDFQQPFTQVTGSFGGGLRFRMLPHDPLNIRIDYGVSTIGDTGFFISLKEAF